MIHGASRYADGCRCAVCREGHRIRQRAVREAARWREIPTHVHGTTHGYGYWDCRCEPCCAAKRAANQRDNPVRVGGMWRVKPPPSCAPCRQVDAALARAGEAAPR